jgi:hypothetical protein
MGIGLALYQVDHPNIVLRGLPVLNEVLRSGDLGPLRELLMDLPFEQAEEVEAYYRERLARLREVAAPPLIIAGEEKRIASLQRPAAEAIDRASLEELREWLGGWCREARTLDLDKVWDLLHWYADPGRRQRLDGDWRSQPAGFSPSPMDYALYGYETYPQDACGQPIIGTGGSPDASWYTPPEVVARVAAAVVQVPTASWEAIDRDIDALPEERQPYLAGVEDRLQLVRELFEQFTEFYQKAARQGFGISVEFY